MGSASNCMCFRLMICFFLIMPDYDLHCCRSRSSTTSFDTKYLERRETQTEVNQCLFLAASLVLCYCLNPTLRGKRDMYRDDQLNSCSIVWRSIKRLICDFQYFLYYVAMFASFSVLYYSVYTIRCTCLHNLIAYKICNKMPFIVYTFLILMFCLYCVR